MRERVLAERLFAGRVLAKGALLDDPSHLFNASLDGKVRRAIDIREGAALDVEAFRRLVRAAVDLNRSARRAKAGRGT